MGECYFQVLSRLCRGTLLPEATVLNTLWKNRNIQRVELLLKNNPKALLLDMDGVLYHGDQVLPGAVDFIHAIRHLPHVFVTNNPVQTPARMIKRLAAMGFPMMDESRILTSAEATANYLASIKPGFHFFAVGADGLHQALSKSGTADTGQADFVVVGEGAGLDFETLSIGINLILKQGARLVSTNPDHNVDATRGGRHWVLPGGGALVAPFAVASGVEPITIGKPHRLLYEMAMQRLGITAGDCLMIGDRPDTDIAGAAGLGMQTAMVRTGRFSPGDRWPDNVPQAGWDVADLPALRDRLDTDCPGWR